MIDCYSGQFRRSGEPYIVHPIQVAGILATLKLDAVTVACGFLHDGWRCSQRWMIWKESLGRMCVIVDLSSQAGQGQVQIPRGASWRKTIANIDGHVGGYSLFLVKFGRPFPNMRTLKHLRKDKQE